MKMRRKRKYNIFIIIIISIFFISYLIISYVGNIITPKINDMVIKTVNKNIYKYVFNTFNKEIMNENALTDILVITKNNDDEIIAIDYNLHNAYTYLSDTVSKLYDNVENIEIDNVYFDGKKDIFFIPIGYVTNNILLSNLGSKVPCKVNLLTDVHIGFRTKVSNYGINNVLVELYVNIETKNSLINPLVEEEFGEKYEVIIASKVIVGRIPAYYGGEIVKSSAIVSS